MEKYNYRREKYLIIYDKGVKVASVIIGDQNMEDGFVEEGLWESMYGLALHASFVQARCLDSCE